MKLLMKELNESLLKLQKEEKREGEEEMPATVKAIASLIPVSPIEEDHEKWICSPIEFEEKSLFPEDVDPQESKKI